MRDKILETLLNQSLVIKLSKLVSKYMHIARKKTTGNYHAQSRAVIRVTTIQKHYNPKIKVTSYSLDVEIS